MNCHSAPPRVALLTLVFCAGVALTPASADYRFIVRAGNVVDFLGNPVPGVTVVTSACNLVGCTVQRGLDDPLGKLFLVTTPETVDPYAFQALLPTLPGIQQAEIDLPVHTMGGQDPPPPPPPQDPPPPPAPPALMDAEPLTYFGATVRGGYLRQPAMNILGIGAAQAQYGVTGHQVKVAIIDTGIDPTHPILQPVLLEGYDFTRNVAVGSELQDLQYPTSAPPEGSGAGFVNQSTMAVLEQSTMAVLEGSEYRAFGHGTMVAGVIHLVAPRALILPLKTFYADGSGYASDVIRAIYFATTAGAKVINMSFSLPCYSAELATAIDHAVSQGALPIAAAGNDGLLTTVYPASLPNVIGVASTTDFDVLSTFSNRGADLAWIAAPGEAIVTTYPLGTYAAAWGTSFATPFAAGTAALLAEVHGQISYGMAAYAEAQGPYVSQDVSNGRLDVRGAVERLRTLLGLP